jgi:hypothetical protein
MTDDAQEVPDVTARYDEGSFDKDEQGWCSHNVELTQQGRRVSMREWGDRNGRDPFDTRREGEIATHHADRGLVEFSGGLTGYVFDTRSRRIALRSYVTREFVPPAEYDGAAFHARCRRLVVELAAALSQDPAAITAAAREDVTPPAWPPAQPSATCAGAVESRSSLVRADATRLEAMRRTLGAPDRTVQLLVALEGAPFSLHVFVWQRQRGTVLFGGPLAREPEADALIDAFRRDIC